MNNKIVLLLLTLLACIFFSPFFLLGKMPIPSDDLVGLYHPYRDYYSNDYPNGIPYKNFLITDPIRQQYPWKTLAIDTLKQGQLPRWNPYAMAGYPLLGNIQSGVLYPLNIFMMISMPIGWSIFIFLQPVLAGIFLYFYLRHIQCSSIASLLGAIIFSYCGFMLSWMEWGNIGHTALWLPLILLSFDKLLLSRNKKVTLSIGNIHITYYAELFWSIILTFSLTFSFFAGHVQTFFYVFLLSLLHVFTRWLLLGRNSRTLIIIVCNSIFFAFLSSVQWVPALQLISHSARAIDVISYTTPGWFVPWQNLIQFLAPDFFGNPATLNYWGVWNYGEFLGYIGIPGLIFALYALFFRRDKKTFFFGIGLGVSILFAFPNPIAYLPFQLHIPMIATAQPTRLLFIIDFCLSILAVLGFDLYLKKSDKKILAPIMLIGIIFILLWGSILFIHAAFPVSNQLDPISIAKRNMLLPSVLFIISAVTITAIYFLKKYKGVLVSLLIILTFFDLYRVGMKFNAFSDTTYLFPQTKTLSFLMDQRRPFRIMTTDSRILAPNIALPYALETIDGYDPLYILRYGELVAASERKKPDISPPFGFNRIITPHNFDSPIIDLLGVKYVLSLSDITSPKLKKVFQEGQTKVYENQHAFQRAFFVQKIVKASSKTDAIQKVFAHDLSQVAIVESADIPQITSSPESTVTFIQESENDISFHVVSRGDEFLVVTNTYYPTWHARVQHGNDKENPIRIFRTDYNFIGIPLLKGEYTVKLMQQML